MLELADEVDSKSIGSNTVRVQVPPPALIYRNINITFVDIVVFLLIIIQKRGKKMNETEQSNSQITSDEKNQKKKTMLIIEIVIIVIALLFIVVAIIYATKKNSNSSDNGSASEASVTDSVNNASDAAYDSAIADTSDISYYLENRPEIQDPAVYCPLSKEECENEVNNNTMLKLELGDGTTAYVVNYKNIDYLKENIVVDDETYHQTLYNSVMANYETDYSGDRDTANWFDTVNIDYVGKLDGVAFEGGTADGASLTLGSGQFISGFEIGVVGMKIGETKDITTHFPEQYQSEELAGKDAIFTVTLNSIDKECPELTDEMVKQSYNDFNTKDELIDSLMSSTLQTIATEFIRSKYYIDSIPEDKALSFYEETLNYCKQSYGQSGATIDQMLEYNGVSKEKFMDDVLTSACKSALSSVVFSGIKETEDLENSEKAVSDILTVYNASTLDEIYSMYGKDVVSDYLAEQTVAEYILSLIQ